MNVSESQRRSSQIIDQIAHEAHIVKKDEHIRGDATAPSGYDNNQYENSRLFELPNVRADNIRAGYDNDVVNVGLAQSLYGPAFGANEAAKRPGMSPQAATKFAATLNGPADANMKLFLQSRADEGFIAAEFANKAVSYLPKDQQPAAAAKWLAESYGDRMKDDLAFATGAKFNAFVHSDAGQKAGLSVAGEMHQISHRAPIANPCVGTIAG